MVDIVAKMISTVSLRDVGRNRYTGPPDLIGQSVFFDAWELIGHLVSGKNQFHPDPPDLKIAVAGYPTDGPLRGWRCHQSSFYKHANSRASSFLRVVESFSRSPQHPAPSTPFPRVVESFSRTLQHPAPSTP